MKKRSIFNTVICVLSVIFLLAGCSQTGDKEQTDGEATSTEAAEEQSKTENTGTDIEANATVEDNTDGKTNDDNEEDNYNEPSELTYLRSQIKENNALVGVAYLDFLPDTSNVSEYSLAVDRISSAMYEKYPFLERCPISFNEGNVAFAVVPASRNATVTIYRSSIDENGMYKDDTDKPIFQSEDGSPIVFLCDDNENYSNILISVKDGDKVVECRPMISLQNGRDIVLSDGCYDFTYYDIRGYKDAAYYYLSTYVDEIRDAIADGLSLSFESEEFMYNHYALKYSLGGYNDGYFVCEKEYIIDSYYTLVHDSADSGDVWQVVGAGLSDEKLASVLTEID